MQPAGVVPTERASSGDSLCPFGHVDGWLASHRKIQSK
jgi:hypothetical protein